MLFVVVLLFAVVAAQPNDRDNWDQFGSLSGEGHFRDPRPGSRTPLRPRWQHKNKQGQMNQWDPEGEPEQQFQDAFDGSLFGKDQTFTDQNGKGNRDEQFDQGTWRSRQWEKNAASGKSQKSGRSGRTSSKPVRVPMHPPDAPADGGRKNQMDKFLGKPLSPNMIDNRQFLPIFKAENVTLQNVSTYHLKEGDNIFLLPKSKEPKPSKGGVKRPQEMGYDYSMMSMGPQPYVKLIYNPTATPRISFEYGITQLLPSFMTVESDSN